MKKNNPTTSKKNILKSVLAKNLLLISCMVILSLNAFAQFPPPSSCTSKDLELVGAVLPGVAPCNTCTPGSSVTRTLYVSIYNKTGSTRTSFAFWGTLEIYNDDGTLSSTQSISGCVGPIPSNDTTTLPSINITYTCGQSLKIINMFLAWTDASPNSTCATLLGSPGTINPKCGTLPQLAINAGVNAIVTSVDATCSTSGSIVVTPSGGTPPYSITSGAVTFNNVTTSATFSNLAAGSYSITITDANNCTATKTRDINPPVDFPDAPAGSNQTQCAQSPVQTLTASATGTNVTWYDAATNGNIVANPVLNSVGSVTYFAQSNLGTCVSDRTPITLTINPTPSAPVSGGNKTECAASPIQTLTATATGSNVTWYDAATNGNLVANPILNSIGTVTYFAQATLGNCVSARTAVTLTINPTPSAPVSGGNKTQCEASPLQTLTATATGSNVTWYDAATNGNLVANPILNSVGTVTYYAQANLGNCVSARTAVTLTINPRPAAPVSGGNITECEQSPIQTLTATATGANITWYTTAGGNIVVNNPILNTVGTVTYYAQSMIGSCKSFTRTPVKLTINPTPPPPVSGGDQAECKQTPIQTLTATATGSNVTWYNVPTGGTAIANPTLHAVGTKTYYAQSKLGACKSLTRTPVTLTIYPNPGAPDICIVDPSLCGPATGSVTFLSPLGAGYSYSIDNGTTWRTNPVFDNLQAGSVSGIKVNDQNGCISNAVFCQASDCSAARMTNESRSETTADIAGNKPSVQAMPNPFTDAVEFEVFVPKAGNATLEIFNLFGQKVVTVFDGYMPGGIKKYSLNLAQQHESYLIYKLNMDGEQVTGKLFQGRE